MVSQLCLIASLAVVLVVNVVAEQPAEGSDLESPEEEHDYKKIDLQVEEDLSLQQEVRKKREAIPGQNNGKKKNGIGRQRKKNGKGKPNRKNVKGVSNKRKGKVGSNKRKGKGGSNKRKGKVGSNKRKGKGGSNKRNGKGGPKKKNANKRKNNHIAKQPKKSKANKRKKNRRAKKLKKSGKIKQSKKSGKGKNSGTPNTQIKKEPKLDRQTDKQKQVSLTCLRDAVTYTKFLKDNVINFLRRNTRLEAQNNLTNKKAGKKGEFKEPAARLIQAGGGDRTNLTCSGSTTAAGAKSMLETVNTLDNCGVSIKNACKPPEANTTMLKECKTNAIKFNVTVSGCIKQATKGKDACSCFQDTAVVKEKAVLESCKGTSQAKAAAKARTKCLKALSTCKTAATTAGKLQYACAFSQKKLIDHLKSLNANLNQFKSFLDKIKKLTGLSPVMPGAANKTAGSGRNVRSDDIEDEDEEILESPQARVRGKRQEVACSTIVTSITTCTTQITNTPASSKVIISCKTPTYTISTCTDADKTSIQSALNSAVEKNGIIIAFIESIKAELKITTGTTPKPSDILPDTTGKAAARSRSMLRKMIMEKMQLRN